MWLLFMWASHLFFHVRHIYGIFIELWASNWIIIDDGDTSISAIITGCFPLICWFDQNTVCTYSLALCRILWLCLCIRIPSTNWKQPHFFWAYCTYQRRLMSIGYLPQTPTALLGTGLICGIDFPSWIIWVDYHTGWRDSWFSCCLNMFEPGVVGYPNVPKCPKWSVAALLNSDGSHAVEDAFKIFGNKAPRLLGDLGSMAWPRLNAQYVVRRPRRNSTNHDGSDIKLWWCPF